MALPPPDLMTIVLLPAPTDLLYHIRKYGSDYQCLCICLTFLYHVFWAHLDCYKWQKYAFGSLCVYMHIYVLMYIHVFSLSLSDGFYILAIT